VRSNGDPVPAGIEARRLLADLALEHPAAPDGAPARHRWLSSGDAVWFRRLGLTAQDFAIHPRLAGVLARSPWSKCSW